MPKSEILSFGYLNSKVIQLKLNGEIGHGDVIKVTPPNDEAAEKLLDYLNKELAAANLIAKVEQLNLTSEDINVAETTSQRSSDQKSLLSLKDFTLPKKALIKKLSEFCTNVTDKSALFAVAGLKGAEFQKYQSDYDLLRLLQEFNCFPTIDFLLDNLAPAKPRYYSVTLAVDDTFSITFNVTGLCTKYLEKCCLLKQAVEYEKHAPIRPFYLPDCPKVLFVCNGTGISPFIGLITDLIGQGRRGVLIYGHRTNQDGLFTKELTEFVKSGLLEFRNVLSREGDKKYVQNSLDGLNLLEYGIMVCGSVPMGKAIDQELIHVKANDCTTEEAVKYWASKRQTGEYKQDLW